MTCPSDTDAPARLAASGSALLRAILVLGLVVGALLLGAGLPRGAEALIAGDHSVLAPAHAALTDDKVVRIADCAVAPAEPQADDGLGKPAFVDPASHLLPRRPGAAFVPRRLAVMSAWDSNPPHRPPRHA